MVFAVSLPFLSELVALFGVSVVIAYICYRFRIVPIVGFLLAGVLIGPNALALVQDQELVNMLAEIGIILLLFTIGIEFSLDKLARIKKAILVGGGLQVSITTLLVAVLLWLFGISWNSGIYTGCLVALSSTAIILGLLNERGETDTPTGQLTLAVLIFQDLAIVLMVLLVPILAGESQSLSDIAVIIGKAAMLIVLVIVLAQRIVPWLLEKVAQTRRQELFLLTVVAICFGTAAVTNLVGVSLALGAFLAGLVVSESHYSEQAISEILPLRTIFNAVFFVSVGMLLDLQYVIEHPLIIAGIALSVILLKFLVSTGSLLALKYPVRIAATAGFGLAQIGEFSFVLERSGRMAGLTPADMGDLGSQIFIAVSVLLMTVTPWLMDRGSTVGTMVSRFRMFGKDSDSQPVPSADKKSLEDHVIIIGYGPAGRHLVQVLGDTGIPYIVIEMNPDSVKEMQQQDIPVIFGDACQQYILSQAVVEQAKLCVIATNDPLASPRIVRQARYLNPTLQIIVRSRYLSELEYFEEMGADIVVPEEMETTVRLFTHVLGAYMVPQEEIQEYVRILRADDYEILRGSIQEAHLMVLQGLDEEGLHTRAVAVREGSPVSGKTLEELELRKKYGFTVLAVKRGENTMGNPAGSFRLQPDDRLVLVGSADQFSTCSALFRTDGPGRDGH
ncbi:cation:proton antiporter domain-containing protein [Fodinibius sediminis]|uniref:Kef-type potassium/proton antiporter, CPA2 family n=1 Tax=Fodinibius sediminis TaxID=1214077 RepID=A0A521BJT0_9BACT|nr:cation:proton antiporter [Fodinibius sediminis]SMO46930.1 Kef-type potassium/proton antiporter, CPA2 family [Fodinibius sediminis]